MRYLINIILFLLLFAVIAKADEVKFTEDAAIESKYLSHSKTDTTGGLQKAGGLYFSLPAITIGGFPVSINKNALNLSRGPDVDNPCAYFGSSQAPSGSLTLCNQMIDLTGDVITCTGGLVLVDGECVENCGAGQGGPGCPTHCYPDQTEVSPGVCKCPDGKYDNGVKCKTDCPPYSYDSDDNGKCECETTGEEIDPGQTCGSVECSGDCVADENNVCRTACPAPLVDYANSCDASRCCPERWIYDDDTNACVEENDCDGGMVPNPDYDETDPTSQACKCNPPLLDNGLPGDLRGCTCPPGTTPNNNDDNNDNDENNDANNQCICANGVPMDAAGNCNPPACPDPVNMVWNPNATDANGQPAPRCFYKCLACENDNGSQCCNPTANNGQGSCCYKDPLVASGTCETRPACPLDCNDSTNASTPECICLSKGCGAVWNPTTNKCTSTSGGFIFHHLCVASGQQKVCGTGSASYVINNSGYANGANPECNSTSPYYPIVCRVPANYNGACHPVAGTCTELFDAPSIQSCF